MAVQILVVDDYDMNRRVIADMLADFDCETTEAADAREAVGAFLRTLTISLSPTRTCPA